MPHAQRGGQIPEVDVGEEGDEAEVRVGQIVVQLALGEDGCGPPQKGPTDAEPCQTLDGDLPPCGELFDFLEPARSEGEVEREDHAEEGAPVVERGAEVPLP